MTIKGKRAQAIRKLGTEELSKLIPGGKWDTSIPEPKIIAIFKKEKINVDIETFKSFFQTHVASYRALIREKVSISVQNFPPVSVQKFPV